ncbi:MAG: hypothetical protein M1817_006109 [Caeruleum heppii]|nr:MAG: hypothetical protein M1817_006109 [Caeruleum heppii]
MDWSPDYCLSCDCQTAGGAYCSQACRLADLESSSAPTQAISPLRALTPGSGSGTHGRSGFGFFLPPAIDFEAYINRLTPPSASASSAGSRQLSGPGTGAPRAASSYGARPAMAAYPKSGLTPSSSGSSLSSLQSTATKEGGQVSDEARRQLRAYANAFDQVRDWKRRTTV